MRDRITLFASSIGPMNPSMSFWSSNSLMAAICWTTLPIGPDLVFVGLTNPSGI